MPKPDFLCVRSWDGLDTMHSCNTVGIVSSSDLHYSFAAVSSTVLIPVPLFFFYKASVMTSAVWVIVGYASVNTVLRSFWCIELNKDLWRVITERRDGFSMLDGSTRTCTTRDTRE